MSMEDIRQASIIQKEYGILSKQGGGFLYPSPFAQEYLFYAIWGNIYICIPPYRVNREGLRSYLLYRILEWEMHFRYEDKSCIARQGDIVLLDGQKKHHYHADGKVRFQHFHFEGNSSKAYFQYLSENFGILYRDKVDTYIHFDQLQRQFESPAPDEHRISMLIHTILSILASEQEVSYSSPVQESLHYIMHNYNKPIQVEDIAKTASLSKSHFSRLFKRETGYSPAGYLQFIRLKHARSLLTETMASVEDIGSQCGYPNSSHFIRTFRKETGITPAGFRKYYNSMNFR